MRSLTLATVTTGHKNILWRQQKAVDMTNKSDIDSIIELLRGQQPLEGGELSEMSVGVQEVEAGSDRTMVIVILGIVAGIVIAAILYYALLYTPIAQDVSTHCNEPVGSNLKKEDSLRKFHVETKKEKVITKPPKQLNIVQKPESPKEDPKPVYGPNVEAKPVQMKQEATQERVDQPKKEREAPAAPQPVQMQGEGKEVFQIGASDGEGFSISKMSGGLSAEFKLPPKPMQPSLQNAQSLAQEGGAAKLLGANKQLIDATSKQDELRKKLQVAQDGLSMISPEVPAARRYGEDVHNAMLTKMREVNGEKLKKVQSGNGGLFAAPVMALEDKVSVEPLKKDTFGEKLHTSAAEGATMSSVATLQY